MCITLYCINMVDQVTKFDYVDSELHTESCVKSDWCWYIYSNWRNESWELYMPEICTTKDKYGGI